MSELYDISNRIVTARLREAGLRLEPDSEASKSCGGGTGIRVRSVGCGWRGAEGDPWRTVEI